MLDSMKVALYARVSKDDGRQDTENQLQELRDFCEREGDIRKLRGNAQIETEIFLMTADEIDFNCETHEINGRGTVRVSPKYGTYTRHKADSTSPSGPDGSGPFRLKFEAKPADTSFHGNSCAGL